MPKPYTSLINVFVTHYADDENQAREQQEMLEARAMEALKDGVMSPIVERGLAPGLHEGTLDNLGRAIYDDDRNPGRRIYPENKEIVRRRAQSS